MTTVTFDTLELTLRLKEVGLPEKQAEEIVRAIVKAQDDLVTRRDLQIEVAPLKWAAALTVSGIVVLVMKAFF